MQRFLYLFISTNCSTCFRQFLHPSSGVQNCAYSVRYCQTNTAACCYRGCDGTQFHLIHEKMLHLVGCTLEIYYTITYIVKLYLHSQPTLQHVSVAATTVISEDNMTHKYIHARCDINSSVLKGEHEI